MKMTTKNKQIKCFYLIKIVLINNRIIQSWCFASSSFKKNIVCCLLMFDEGQISLIWNGTPQL